MTVKIESLAEQLLEKGIRPSYQRLKVYEYLRLKKGHPTADEIFNQLSRETPPLSKATVYNTLHTFVEAGLARIISIDGDEIRYDMVLSNHGHFKCDLCGEITNFAIAIDETPTGGLERFEVRNKNVYFNGVCPKCIQLSDRERIE